MRARRFGHLSECAREEFPVKVAREECGSCVSWVSNGSKRGRERVVVGVSYVLGLRKERVGEEVASGNKSFLLDSRYEYSGYHLKGNNRKKAKIKIASKRKREKIKRGKRRKVWKRKEQAWERMRKQRS